MSEQNRVDFEVIGESKFKLAYNGSMLDDHILDYATAKAKDRPGQMRRLLAGAACGCFSGHFYTALRKRKVQVNSLRSWATTNTGTDPESGLSRVTDILIRLEIEVPDADADSLKATEEELRSEGCLIVRSLAPGISVKTEIVRVQAT